MAGVVVLNQVPVTLYDSSGVEIGPATEATVATLSTEVTLEAARVLLASLDGKDFATETTQATLATEAKLEAVRVLLASLDGKDFATETTLGAIGVILTSINAKDFATETTQATLATEAKLETVRALLASLNGKDFATQTTLVAADVKLGTIDAVLDAIKDTDGVADLAKWLGSSAPTVGQKLMASSIPVTIASDQSAISVTSGSSVGTGSIAELLRNGGSADMVVNGSGTPVKFVFSADPTNDITLLSVRFVITVGGSFDFDGDTFGDGGSALANGVSVDIIANGGTFAQQVTEFTVNEDFARLLDFQPFADIDTILTASLPFGGNVILQGGTADEISVTINDNVAQSVRGIDYYTATVYGVIE